MKKTNLIYLIFTSTFLVSCAVTPQEKAQERLNFQVNLARQCDPIAADLMAQLPKISTLSIQERAIFDNKYQERVNNPTFQACYKMAFKSYSEQQQLNYQRMEWEENENYFNNPPYNCEFYPAEGSYWGAC